MKRLNVALPLIALGVALLAQPAYAHGFGERTELPVPLGFFLIGAGAAVALSFAIIGVFVGKKSDHGGYWQYNLFQNRWVRNVLTSAVLLLPLRLLSVFLLGLVIATGLAGEQIPSSNFAPTFVWIIWWVGLAFFVALIGNLWGLLNPWDLLFSWAEKLYSKIAPGRQLSLGWEYPTGWGIWPAIILFLAFVWIQDAFPQSDLPNRVAIMAIVYSIITLGAMTLFGRHEWLRRGEAFSVVFSFLARFAPTEVRVNDQELCQACGDQCQDQDGECINCYECFEKAEVREFNIRPFAVGLSRSERVTNDILAIVVLLLATVTFDGFSATPAWVDFQTFILDNFAGVVSYDAFNSLTIADTLGVVFFPVAFLILYLTFSYFMSRSVEGALGVLAVARASAFSLLPIALAYNIAHFITLLLIQGQLIVRLVSDPFGFDWNLFGTADYAIDISVINARVLWFLSIGVIVLGHILAVYLAHLVSIRIFKDRTIARNSQYPMLMLMVMYTVVSLWIIAQPIVA